MKEKTRTLMGLFAAVAAVAAVGLFVYALMGSEKTATSAVKERIEPSYRAQVMSDIQISHGYMFYPIYICQGSGVGDGKCRIRMIDANSVTMLLGKGDEIEVFTAEDPIVGDKYLSVSQIIKIK